LSATLSALDELPAINLLVNEEGGNWSTPLTLWSNNFATPLIRSNGGLPNAPPTWKWQTKKSNPLPIPSSTTGAHPCGIPADLLTWCKQNKNDFGRQ